MTIRERCINAFERARCNRSYFLRISFKKGFEGFGLNFKNYSFYYHIYAYGTSEVFAVKWTDTKFMEKTYFRKKWKSLQIFGSKKPPFTVVHQRQASLTEWQKKHIKPKHFKNLAVKLDHFIKE